MGSIKNTYLPGLIVLLVCIFSCRSRDKTPGNGKVFCDYMVMGDEDAGYVTVKLQYSIEGADAMPVEQGSVELDGELLEADSARMNGTYYELIRPVNEFAGRHIIRFKKGDLSYSDTISFEPFSLRSELPDEAVSGDIKLELDGLTGLDVLRVIVNDTAARSEGIDRTDTVGEGLVRIGRSELAGLSPGPVFLELVKERETRLVEGNRLRGRLFVSYAVRREFVLKDARDSLTIH